MVTFVAVLVIVAVYMSIVHWFLKSSEEPNEDAAQPVEALLPETEQHEIVHFPSDRVVRCEA